MSQVPIDPSSSLSDAMAAARRRHAAVRARSISLAQVLSPEDQGVQSMPDASPTKWHLGHTTWFFEAMLLGPHHPSYAPFDARLAYLFNSYYESLGPRQPRSERGMLTRPALDEVLAYRRHVDAAVDDLLAMLDERSAQKVLEMLELGLNHEQQHQELIVTDIVHAFSRNPLFPAFEPGDGLLLDPEPVGGAPAEWIQHPGGVIDIGHDGPGFSFDNERPRHPVLLRPFAISDRLVSNREYLAFVNDHGYKRPELWLSDGWAMLHASGWQSPGYWVSADSVLMPPTSPSTGWLEFGPLGLRPLDLGSAVTHISFYEAAAYAHWAGARLPTEFEWEAAAGLPGMRQLANCAWQWTRSAYEPYPGFRPLQGAAAEYNGKFMVGQLVLRGASMATPPGHARPSYRNFFPPATRWQIAGLRLAKDA
ncbi:MAG: ergothioneine biosynthesis protein EgtB [Paucibacter sp.]|nr:ergothioneine biosynthesis protein EgtB [Roseateles sp.]